MNTYNMKTGWWDLKITGFNPTEVSDMTLEHIAEQIKNGMTSGQIIEESGD